MLRASSKFERLRLSGAVVLAIGVILVDARQTGDWDAFFRLVVAGIPCAALYVIAFSIAVDGRPLERWQTAAALSGLALLFLSLIQLADMLGASGNISSGNGFWVSGLIAIAAAAIATRFHSPIHTLVAAIMLVVSILFFIDWISDELSLETARNALVVFTILYWGTAYGARRLMPDLDRLHGDYLVVAGGLAGIIAGTLGAFNSVPLLVFGEGPPPNASDGWELFLLSVSMLLIYYTAWQGYRAAAYLGTYGLLSFVVIAANGDGIAGWPLLLVIVGALALGVSLTGERPGSSQPGEPRRPDTLHP